MESKLGYGYSPVRVYSDASGAGGLASLMFMASDERPLPRLPQCEAEQKRHSRAATATKISLIEISGWAIL